MDATSLLRRQPFARLDPLTHIEPLAGEGARSGSAFWATGRSGRRYKLRACRTSWRARNLESYLGLLGDWAPPLVAREGRLLLLERLDGFREMERLEILSQARSLGRLAAELHRDAARAGLPGRNAAVAVAAAARLQFRRDLARLVRAGLIEGSAARQATRKVADRVDQHGLPVSLEMDDLHKGNFLLREPSASSGSEAGPAMRYVDEQGLALRPLGMGLASLLKTATRSRSWHEYCEGYAEIEAPPMRDPERVELLLLLDAVRRAARKHRHADRLDKLPDELEAVRAITSTPEVSLRWCFPGGY